MRWYSCGGGEDLGSDCGRFVVVFTSLGAVGKDMRTGEMSALLDNEVEARQWCEDKVQSELNLHRSCT